MAAAAGVLGGPLPAPADFGTGLLAQLIGEAQAKTFDQLTAADAGALLVGFDASLARLEAGFEADRRAGLSTIPTVRFDDVDANVNHPAHYADGWSNGAEVIDITEHLNFCRGNAVKYLARAGAKDPSRELEDLRKARWYVDREIARLEAEAEL